MLQNGFQMHFPINRISGSELDGGEGRMIQQRLEDCSLHSSRRKRRRGGDVIVHSYLPSIMKSAAAYAEENEEGTKDVHSYHHSIMLIVIKTSDSYTAEWG